MKSIKNKKMHLILVGAFISTASISSFAQNHSLVKETSLVTSQQKKELIKHIVVDGQVTQIGTPTTLGKDLKGFANELPLIIVMKQITPNGWIVRKNDSEENPLNTKKLVSWSGGESWIATLEKIAKTHSVNAEVNWDDKTITLSSAIKIVELKKPTKSVFELAGTESATDKSSNVFVVDQPTTSKVTDIAVGASEQNTPLVVKEEVKVAAPVVEPKPVVTRVEKASAPIFEPKPVVAKVEKASTPVKQLAEKAEMKPSFNQVNWELKTIKSLKENVEMWAEASGYRLVWTGEDYPVVDTRILAGEFDSENGPIKQLSVDYGPDSRVQTPLSFQFYQNKTLVVENWMFEQTGFPQFNKKQ